MEVTLDRNASAHFVQHDQDISRYWRWCLFAIDICKAAIGGAGLFIALAGLDDLFLRLVTGEATANVTLFYAMSIVGALLGGLSVCLGPLFRAH
jgi:hypothetical protein